MSKLEELLLSDLQDATRFLASALFGQFDGPRREEAKAFLLRAHDSREAIDLWTLGLPVHGFDGVAGNHCVWVAPDGRNCDHFIEHSVAQPQDGGAGSGGRTMTNPADNACPTCSAPFVSAGSGTTMTLVGFSSPPGHDHDDNCLIREYTCANGHRTGLSIRRKCPVPGCDWMGKESCFCHPGVKVAEWPVAANTPSCPTMPGPGDQLAPQHVNAGEPTYMAGVSEVRVLRANPEATKAWEAAAAPEKWVVTSRGARPVTAPEPALTGEAANDNRIDHPLPWRWIRYGEALALADGANNALALGSGRVGVVIPDPYVRAVTERAKALEQVVRAALPIVARARISNGLVPGPVCNAGLKLIDEIDAAKKAGRDG